MKSPKIKSIKSIRSIVDRGMDPEERRLRDAVREMQIKLNQAEADLRRVRAERRKYAKQK